VFTIPKASTPEHVAENAEAGVLPLTQHELALIDKAFPLNPSYCGLAMLKSNRSPDRDAFDIEIAR
jgi:diketogulonate reductase-like aldo/keto reductase